MFKLIDKNYFMLKAYVATSLLGLILIYIAAITIQPSQTPLSSIDASFVGRTVTTSGYVQKVSSGNNVFITISDNSATIGMPLFANFLQSTKIDTDRLRVDKKISVTGLVDEYNGQLQIIPRKASDVVVE